MVVWGFINYYFEEEIVEVKDKVFLYVDVYWDLIDYDVFCIWFIMDSINVVMNLLNNSIDI